MTTPDLLMFSLKFPLDISSARGVGCPQQQKSKWPGRRANAPGPGRPAWTGRRRVLSHTKAR